MIFFAFIRSCPFLPVWRPCCMSFTCVWFEYTVPILFCQYIPCPLPFGRGHVLFQNNYHRSVRLFPAYFRLANVFLLDNFLFSGRLLSGRLLPALLSFSKRPFDRARSVHCLYQASDKDTAKRGRLPKADWLAWQRHEGQKANDKNGKYKIKYKKHNWPE